MFVNLQAINFKMIPPQFQVLFSNCVGFLWNIYLSSIMTPVASVEVKDKNVEDIQRHNATINDEHK